MTVPASDSLYEILEVSPNASAAVIRAAYRCLVQMNHPDKNSGDVAAEARLYQINRAYAVLADAHERARYDKQMGLRGSDRRGAGHAARPARGGTEVARLRPFVFRPIK